MKKEQEKKCVNWFMHKRGKQWIYGCGVLVCGIVLGTVATPVMADEAGIFTNGIGNGCRCKCRQQYKHRPKN